MKKLLLLLFAFSFLLSPAPNPRNRRIAQVYKYDNNSQKYFNVFQGTANYVTDPYRKQYDRTIKYLIQKGDWVNMDCFYIDATGNEAWALVDVRTPTRSQTINNTYAGRFTANLGWIGNNSLSMLSGFNPGDGGTYNLTRNNASFGVLMSTTTAATSKHEVSSFDAGYGQGIFVNANINKSICLNSVSAPTTTYSKYIFSNYGWFGGNRTTSTNNNVLINGVNEVTQTSASTALNNAFIGRMGARNTAGWTGGFYSLNIHSAFYAGNSSVNQKNIINAINNNFSYLNAAAKLNKRVFFEGDSRTASVTFPTLSSNSFMAAATMTTLGNGWSWGVVAEANETVQSMITQAATEIDPYRNVELNKDILVFFAGTNDLAANRTGAQLYADVQTWMSARRALGFRCVIIGECDRDAGFSGGQTAAGYNTARGDYRALMQAYFTISTAITNCYTDGQGNYWIDTQADAAFNNASDVTYYKVDQIHPNSTAYNIIANTYLAPLILIL